MGVCFSQRPGFLAGSDTRKRADSAGPEYPQTDPLKELEPGSEQHPVRITLPEAESNRRDRGKSQAEDHNEKTVDYSALTDISHTDQIEGERTDVGNCQDGACVADNGLTNDGKGRQSRLQDEIDTPRSLSVENDDVDPPRRGKAEHRQNGHSQLDPRQCGHSQLDPRQCGQNKPSKFN